MRIDVLNLQAFGPFTDRRLDFTQGSEGVHIVFGANEAGKSSALRAIRNALFGIPIRSRDNFLVPYAAMRLGFALRSSNGNVFSAVRRKAQQRTLIHPETEEPLADAALAALLAGVDDDAFGRIFGLDQETLRSGGREITEMQGDVGGTLFAAAGGLVRLRQIREALDKEASDIFKPRGQNQALNSVIGQFQALKARVREDRRSSRDYKDKSEELRRAREEAQLLSQQLRECRAEESIVDRIMKSRRLIEAVNLNSGTMATLAGTRVLREGFVADFHEANDALLTAQTRLQGAQTSVEQIDRELNTLDPPAIPPDSWQVASRLSDNLGAFRKARQDLQGIQRKAKSDRADLEPRLARLRPDLALEDYEKLFLSAVDRQRITSIGTRLTTAQATTSTTESELKKAEQQRSAAEAALDKCPESIDTQRLSDQMTAAAAKGQVEEEHDKQTLRFENERDAIQLLLDRAGRWKGTLTALNALSLPSMVTIETHEGALTKCEDALRRATEARETAVRERSRLSNELDALLAVEGDLPSEEDVAAARSSRDGLWRRIRESWVTKSSEVPEADVHRVDRQNLEAVGHAYAELVITADDVVDRVRREHTRVAQRARLESESRAQNLAIEAAEQKISTAEDALEEATRAWKEVWASVRVDVGTPREMRDWLTVIGTIRTRGDAIDALQKEIEPLEEFITAHKRSLLAALEEIGVAGVDKAATLNQLLASCRTITQEQIDLRQQRARLNTALDTARQRVKELSGQLKTCHDGLAMVTKEWAMALAEVGIPADIDTTAAATWMTECMEIHAQAHRLLGPDGSVARIRHIESDFTSFISHVTDVVHGLGEPATPPTLATVEDVAASVLERIQQSKSAARAISDVMRRRGAAVDELNKRRTECEVCQSKITALEQEAGAEPGGDLAELCKQSDKLRDLQRERQKLEADLQGLADTYSLPEWREIVDAKRHEDLPRQLSELKTAIETLESQKTEKDEQVGGLAKELETIGAGTAAVDVNVQMQAKLAEIEAHAREYVRLWMSSQVLRRAVDAYRDRNQGEVLRVASEYFAKLTEGAFTGLTIDYADETPVIAGRRAGQPTPMRVEAMSEGTTDQLFLAMRLAYIDIRTRDHEPMPLILDDVLGTYDDDRAAATLKALSEVSRKTQVILFTHHRHLLRIAEQNVPQGALFIQELTA